MSVCEVERSDGRADGTDCCGIITSGFRERRAALNKTERQTVMQRAVLVWVECLQLVRVCLGSLGKSTFVP
jgi:hypothetical protein